jgi:hypothetical protein
VHVDPVFVEPPTGGIDPVPESREEQAPEVNVDGGAGEIPELVSCEMFPSDGQIPAEWLRPFEIPEEFLVTIFEGEGETDVVDNGDEVAIEGEGVPFDLESGFEICVLPVPEDFSAGFDPNELLARYEESLSQDPNWLPGLAEGQGDWFYEQVTTASAYFEKLEFGTPGEASAFDHWFVSNFGAAADGTSEEGTDYGNEQPDYADGSWSFDPKDLMHRYDAFLAENPDWGALDPDVMEAQVITASKYFGELEFGTPSKAAAFDSWYVTQFVGNALPDVDAQDGNVESDPAEDSQPFDPRELLPRYDAFLAQNPTWIDVNQGSDIQLQVITPSGYFPELEFGNPGEATAFDNWYTSWYAAHHNSDGSPTSVEDSGTLLVTGQPVDLPTEIHLPGESSGDGEIVLKGDGELSWLDRGAINGDIQPNWRSGGEAPEFAYSSAPGGSGLVLGGGTLATGGLSGGTVVTGGEVMNLAGDDSHGSASESGAGTLSGPDLSLEGRAENFAANTVVTGGELSLSGDVTVDSFEGNTVALSNGSSVVLQGGQVVSGETLYAFNPELAGERGYAGDLPVEILVPDALGTEASSLFGNAAAGLAPTPGQALIVEFGVLSPSQNAAEQMQDGRSLSVVADTAEVLPQSSPFAATEKLEELPATTAALSAAAEGDYEPHSATPAASLDAMNDAFDARHDSTTVAAGAVAVGGVAHGSGAAAASVRKPLPKL